MTVAGSQAAGDTAEALSIGPDVELSMTWLRQRKDNPLLCLDGDNKGDSTTSGVEEAWDAIHPDGIYTHGRNSCVRASIAMIVTHYGGDLSMDRIGYRQFENWGSPMADISVTPRSDEPAIWSDADGDGVMDWDEQNRFHTMATYANSDDDWVQDKQDLREYVFDGAGAYSLRGADFDADGRRKELDADNDNDTSVDGCEDSDRDGKYESARVKPTTSIRPATGLAHRPSTSSNPRRPILSTRARSTRRTRSWCRPRPLRRPVRRSLTRPVTSRCASGDWTVR